MNKLFGKTERFKLINTTGNRTVVSYDREDVDEENSTWREVSFSKSHGDKPGIEQIRQAIIADIDAQTDDKILCGMEWKILHGDDEGKIVKVWLSKENQENFKAKHDAALTYPQLVTFPITYKVSENNDKTPVYEHFQTIEELARFYLGGLDYIEQCLREGWMKKDTFDFSPYEAALETLNAEDNAEAL